VILLILGFGRGETITAMPTLGATAALLYLTTFGSLIAISAYTYLLRNVRPALATSYAFVNPVIALFLGVALGGEVLTGSALLALPLILAGVAFVIFNRKAN
jgi:drug/metabolite transporter (DMT)-like permease